MFELPQTRATLIARLKNTRDHEAWLEFTTIYEPLITRLACGHGLQQADAQDICQQVFAAVAKDVERWKPDGRDASFRRWLFQIARNRVVQFLAKTWRDVRAKGWTDEQVLLAPQPDPGASASAEFEREYRQQLLLRAAALVREEVKKTTWQAFWLTSVEGRPIAEIATELGMTVGNVYVSRSRIIARLRDMVKAIEGS